MTDSEVSSLHVSVHGPQVLHEVNLQAAGQLHFILALVQQRNWDALAISCLQEQPS